MLKLGIIGTGGICNNKHLPSLAKVADKVEVVALCDLDEEKAIATKERHGLTNAKIYTDYKELLADPSIDVVHVCTPNVAHCRSQSMLLKQESMYYVKNQWQRHLQMHRKC